MHKDLKQSMTVLMARLDLSSQVKLSDEFTHHNSASLKLIEDAISKLKALPHSDPPDQRPNTAAEVKKEQEQHIIVVAKKCVGIHGSEAEGIISHCQIHDSKQCGIMVYENGTGQIENCDLRDNAKGAWDIEDGCQVCRNGNKE